MKEGNLLEIPLQRFERSRLKSELVKSILLAVGHSIAVTSQLLSGECFKSCVRRASRENSNLERGRCSWQQLPPTKGIGVRCCCRGGGGGGGGGSSGYRV